jgi:2-amino-4-hydroxy-6-hydroxymethyldihydropteridine diphosphokinase
MAYCLIALGSNLGDRTDRLRQAAAELSRLPATRLVARSSWHETQPIGGPAGQGAFINAAAVIHTGLQPVSLLAELQRIELCFGRERNQRWAARTIDLDLLLYESLVLRTDELQLPHPRMAFRRFVLAPAAEIAGQMVHPDSGWTVAALANHFERSRNSTAIAASDHVAAGSLVRTIAAKLQLEVTSGVPTNLHRPGIGLWPMTGRSTLAELPKLLIALADPGGVNAGSARKMLHLPPTGPVAWIDVASPMLLEESLAAVQAVWPELAT